MLVYATTTFIDAFLMFALEPMVAKMLLPTLGGTPMVWNTCVVFFQGVHCSAVTRSRTSCGS